MSDLNFGTSNKGEYDTLTTKKSSCPSVFFPAFCNR